MTSMRRLVVALGAASLLLLAAGTSSASRGIAFSPTSWTATSTALTFTDEEGSFSIVCEVILSITITFGETSKINGSPFGHTTWSARNCRGGEVRLLAEPELFFVSFTGTLPGDIRSIRIELRNFQFLVRAFFGAAQCLFGGPVQVTTGGGSNRATEMRADETRIVPMLFRLGGIFCPILGVFRGTFRFNRTITMSLL
ncbi:MAG: hypothetical protein WBC33_00540 [Conexibacter sp.]